MPICLPDLASNLRLLPDGLWVTGSTQPVSFPPDGNRHCFAVEDQSFWFAHRNRCILSLLGRFPPPGVFFDVGGGNGFVTLAIQRAGYEAVLLEPGPAGAQNARARGIAHVVCGRFEDAGFLPGILPAVGLFDVLEHIAEDASFLRLLHRAQPPGGRLYLSVPALPSLWSHEDKIAGHFRRYSLSAISNLLSSTGYVVEFAAACFTFLLLPVALLRALPYRLGLGRAAETEASIRADHQISGAIRLRILRWLIEREMNRLASARPPRLGTSCLVVARRSA